MRIKEIKVMLAFLIVSLMLGVGVNALPDQIFKQNEQIMISEPCNVNTTLLCSPAASCNITIFSPNNTVIIDNQPMTNKISYHNYTINSSMTTALGNYNYAYYCCDGADGCRLSQAEFSVTKNGEQPAGDNFLIFIYILFVLSIIGIFYTFFLTFAKLVTASSTIYDVLVSWGFYILLIIVYYLSANYMSSMFIQDISSEILDITVWTNGVLPLLSFIITMFVKGTQKKRPMSVRDLGGGELT